MEIIYSSSDAYSMCTGISLYSLYKNNVDIDILNVHILSTDISDENKNRLKSIALSFNRSLNIIDAKNDFINWTNKLNLSLFRDAYNTYSRLMLNIWFKHLDKIMVIDSDTLVCGSIKDAWNIDIKDYYIAAVPEVAMYGKDNFQEDPDLLNSLDMYYNMGVCIVNLKKWREDDIDRFIFNSVQKETKPFMLADQSILNKYLSGNITRMPLKYNFYTPCHHISYKVLNSIFNQKRVFTEDEYEDAITNPAIIHYLGHSYERPWFKNNAAYKNQNYLSVKMLTPWKEFPLSKWSKPNNLIICIYDFVCYLLLILGLYSICIKFKYIIGQNIKGIMKIHR